MIIFIQKNIINPFYIQKHNEIKLYINAKNFRCLDKNRNRK